MLPIDDPASATVDLIAFTSPTQVRRLQDVAARSGKTMDLDTMQNGSVANFR